VCSSKRVFMKFQNVQKSCQFTPNERLVHLLIRINQLLGSVFLCPKVVPLSSANCIYKTVEWYSKAVANTSSALIWKKTLLTKKMTIFHEKYLTEIEIILLGISLCLFSLNQKAVELRGTPLDGITFCQAMTDPIYRMITITKYTLYTKYAIERLDRSGSVWSH
jgi:hypothetical protein